MQQTNKYAQRASDPVTTRSSARGWPAWTALLAALFGGLTIGAGVNVVEKLGVPGASDFGNYFGFWIALVTVIAAYSLSWRRAVLCVVAFLLAMVAAYYITTLLVLGYFLTRLVFAWAVVALVFGPPFAAFVWRARGEGWQAALGAALPVGLLLWEAYSLRWHVLLYASNTVQVVFNIVAAVALLLILPQDWMQRLRVLMLCAIVMLSTSIFVEYVWAVVGALMW